MDVSSQLHATTDLPPGRVPGTYWIGGWMGPRASLDAVPLPGIVQSVA